jgi:4-hydroxybenzoate polyprenyltransferase
MIRRFLSEIKIEHTLFALPFAYVGAILAAHGVPSVSKLVWITLAVLGARTSAMAANRYIDRDVDAHNPRTAKRGLVTGEISPKIMLRGIAGGLILLIVSAFALNPLCVALLPIAGLGILAYPFCKRFTWGTHFVLGAIDGFAPLGAFIAISNTISFSALVLFAAVTLWVAGFDIIYALMDHDLDVKQNIRSIPARFGIASAHTLPIALHLLVMLLLLALVPLAHPHPVYAIGVFFAAILVWYEHTLLTTVKDVFALNERIFNANMSFSLAFLATTVAGFTLK